MVEVAVANYRSKQYSYGLVYVLPILLLIIIITAIIIIIIIIIIISLISPKLQALNIVLSKV